MIGGCEKWTSAFGKVTGLSPTKVDDCELYVDIDRIEYGRWPYLRERRHGLTVTTTT